MATSKVHDQDDQDFAEIDIILAQAKLDLHRDRCRDRKLRRNMNLSDIPENFAHVPSCTAREENLPTPRRRPVSLDTSQPDLASRAREPRDRTRGRPKLNPKLQLLSLIAPMKWLRGYMGCVVAIPSDRPGNCTAGRSVKGSEYSFPPPLPSRQRVGYGV